jgi:CHRD domain
MKLKLIAALFISCFFLASCDKEDDTHQNPDRTYFISNYDFFLTAAQVVPATTSTANGRIEGTYDRKSKFYNYKITWSGLSSAVTAIHIHGVADRGFVALPLAPVAAYPNGIVSNITGFSTATSGTYSGSLFIDKTVIKEADLLNGKFYVDIHTTNFPNGEIRGQILFP